MKRLLFRHFIFLLPFSVYAQLGDSLLIRGVDISFTPQIENLGGKYKLNGVEKDVLDIFNKNGANYVQLRLWHTPSGGWSGLAKTLEYAARVKAKGFKFHLDFHYSDWWADVGKQNKPAAWVGISFAALRESVYTYTKYVIEAMKNQNTLPDMVQIGNEITAGMLWNDGRVGGSYDTPQQWTNLGDLIKEGIRGARDGASDSTMKIMIHIDRGGDNNGARWFFDNLIAQGVQFDVIGLSYYPWWHGTLTQLKNNLNDLAIRYGKDIIIVETAYPWTTQSLNDGMGNIGVDPAKLPPGYSISPQGQKAFLFAIRKILKETVNNRGIGFFYWEPAYISVPPIGSSWEHLTTFDFAGSAHNSLTAFMNLDTMKSVNVRLRINTATVADTLKPSGLVQVRGELVGVGSYLLPSGELCTWDSYSQVLPVNIGGDYWEYQFSLYQSDQLEFKIWTGHNSSTPTYLRLGWEGPITPFDGSHKNARLFKAAANDTTLDVQFYNSANVYVDQYWSPIQRKTDSIGVLFRVNVAELTRSGLFDPSLNGPVVVRGDSTNSAGVLSWSSNNVILNKETLSVANGSFWSGVAYFPKATIATGTQIKYKFFVVKSSFGGWEFNINDRVFTFPANDTTLAWRFFNERLVVTQIDQMEAPIPNEMQLYQNFPNPFNPITSIRYVITRTSSVKLHVYNTLGQTVRKLTEVGQDAGEHVVTWTGLDDAGKAVGSGVYFVRLEADGAVQLRKMLLIR